jgi:hypothetical protein
LLGNCAGCIMLAVSSWLIIFLGFNLSDLTDTTRILAMIPLYPFNSS